MGVSDATYWLCAVLWDCLCACLVVGACLGCVHFYKVPVFSDPLYYPVVLLIFSIYLPMLLVFGFNVSFFFDR